MPRCETLADLAPNQRCWTSQSVRTCSSSSGSGGIVLLEQEPVEAARREREQGGQLADRREARAPEHLDRAAALELAEVELDGLGGPSQVVDAQGDVALPLAHVGEDAVVGRAQRLVGAQPEHGVLL